MLSERQQREVQTIHKTDSEKPSSIEDDLYDLRKYLAPDVLYHRGKRGGLNYQKPRKLLDDLQSTIWTTEQSRSSR